MKWMILLVALAGCSKKTPTFDAQASAAYRVAWEKKQNGDEAGYRAGLEQVKKQYPGTRAGDRARQQLERK
jgi:hypothetical protein